MPRVCRNDGKWHTQKTPGNDPSYFEAVDLGPHLHQNSFHCVLNLLRAERTKENDLYFRRHEKELPPCGMDLAIKGEDIQRHDQVPVPRIGLALQAKELCHQRLLFDQNRTDFGWRHEVLSGKTGRAVKPE